MKDNMTIEEARRILQYAREHPHDLRTFDIAMAHILDDDNISQMFREALKQEGKETHGQG